jgi:hypothetical protein
MNSTGRTVMDILKVLDRSNCRECGLKTCMAFAAQVVQGTRELDQCPRVPREALDRFGGARQTSGEPDDDRRAAIDALKARVGAINLAEAARRIGGELSGDLLTIRCFERIFQIDHKGDLSAQCHVNFWVHMPLLEYMVRASGAVPTGDWVRFRELEGALDWSRFFEHRCERAMRDMADGQEDVFLDVLQTFAGRPPRGILARRAPEADWTLLVYPLPKVPLLFAYWRAEGAFEPVLSLLLDRSATENLSAGAIYTLVQGVVIMFQRIIRRHTHGERWEP